METVRLAVCLSSRPHRQVALENHWATMSWGLRKEHCSGVSTLPLGGALRKLRRPLGVLGPEVP